MLPYRFQLLSCWKVLFEDWTRKQKFCPSGLLMGGSWSWWYWDAALWAAFRAGSSHMYNLFFIWGTSRNSGSCLRTNIAPKHSQWEIWIQMYGFGHSSRQSFLSHHLACDGSAYSYLSRTGMLLQLLEDRVLNDQILLNFSSLIMLNILPSALEIVQSSVHWIH